MATRMKRFICVLVVTQIPVLMICLGITGLEQISWRMSLERNLIQESKWTDAVDSSITSPGTGYYREATLTATARRPQPSVDNKDSLASSNKSSLAKGDRLTQVTLAKGDRLTQVTLAKGDRLTQVTLAKGDRLTQVTLAKSDRLTQAETANNTVKDSAEKLMNDRKMTLSSPILGTPMPNVFQPIDKKAAWLYSAYYDHVAAGAGKPTIRAFGITKSDLLLDVYCNMSTENNSFSSTGKLIEFPDSHSTGYSPSYVECTLPRSVRPTFVSISFQTKEPPTNRLQVLYPGPLTRNFTVCYSVLHSNFSAVSQLIESIETNRILGAEHFVVYNYSVSPKVNKILHRYQDDGLVTVFPWSLPTSGSHYFAQMTAINDCIYRNRNSSRFVVVADTDEYIIPRKHLSWAEMIASISPQESDVSRFSNSSVPSNGTTLTGCFMIMSSYFAKNAAPNWDSLPPEFNFTNEERSNIIKYQFLGLSQFYRADKIYPPRNRSKYFARPDLVYIAGIHFARKFVHWMRCHNVQDTVALLHHYRKPYNKIGFVQDTSILKLKQKLYQRVMEQYKRSGLL